MTNNKIDFTFSDLIAGYVVDFDSNNEILRLKTSDDREYNCKLTTTSYAEMVRNLNEPYIDCTGELRNNLLEPGRYLHAYGTFYPESDGYKFEAKHIVTFGKNKDEFRFEKANWWVEQITSLGDFYLKSQFENGIIDYTNYSTNLNLEGKKEDSIRRQETDTISRLIYGFSSAYLLTGEDRFLEAAEKGTKYLRDNLRVVDESQDIAYWYHGMEINGGKVRKMLGSEFGDDYNAIPAYEQIYALAGPTQLLRITGDKEIQKDIEMTVNLFDKYYLDNERGGYYSHLDPATFSPKSDSLGDNKARKNWNSVGDHTPAYLINAYLATGSERYKKMLKSTADIIVKYFQDYNNSPFIQEKFFEDWSHDTKWKWQQNRSVVGHNLKIAWNLMRVNSLINSADYQEFSRNIAEKMPKFGYDKQRGGWYDVVERLLGEGEEINRLVFHDRKAWWQQEQGILAYLILGGIVKDKRYIKYARESSAFYNAWFLDQDSGGVYFNVLANGTPYLLGTERGKGSHSMSGYHSFELAYLAATYSNLLVTKQPMDFYFKPYPASFKDNKMNVAPDLLPQGSIKIEAVWIENKEWTDFDAKNMVVNLPDTMSQVRVKVRVAAV